MSMISEQIKEIEAVKRKYEQQNITLLARIPTEHDIKAISGAISTIKELSAKLHTESMERIRQYYNGGWIPTSERLPCDREWYLVTCQDPDTGFIGVPFIGDYLNGKHTKITTDDGWILRGFTDWDDTPIYDYYKKLKVIAYAPLPERYKPKESEKNHD